MGKGSVSKAFSIKEHGPEKAKLLAIEERERQLEQKLMPDTGTLAPSLRRGASRHGQAAVEARPQQ